MMIPKEYEEDIGHHQELLSGSSWELGRIHWYIQKADTEMNRRCFVEREDGQIRRTPFGEDVGIDEINWWIFKRETEIEELKKRTEITLSFVQKLKEDSFVLKEKRCSKIAFGFDRNN